MQSVLIIMQKVQASTSVVRAALLTFNFKMSLICVLQDVSGASTARTTRSARGDAQVVAWSLSERNIVSQKDIFFLNS